MDNILHCWYCTLLIDGNIWRMPTAYDDRDGIFTVIGSFCCPQCIYAYLLDVTYVSKYDLCQIFDMYLQRGNISMDDIFQSPKKEIMEMYGGDLSTNQYRDLINRKYELPSISVKITNNYFSILDLSSNKSTDSYIYKEKEESKIPGKPPYKLYRTKPLPNNILSHL